MLKFQEANTLPKVVKVSKGLSVTLSLAIVTFFAVALVANIGIERVAEIEDRMSMHAVPLVAQRVEVAIYTLNAGNDGEVQLNLRDEYNLSKNPDRITYNFTSYIPSQDDTRRSEINPPEGVGYVITEEGRSEYICLRKTGIIKVSPGEC